MTNKLPSTERSLPIALLRAREGVMAPIREMLSETGMTEQQWRVLRVLSEYGAMDAKTLSGRANLLFPSLTRIAATLREKGFVEQNRNELDKRKSIISITTDGQTMIDRHSFKAEEIADQFKIRLGIENYELLLDLLNMLGTDDTKQHLTVGKNLKEM